jgi:hypothetical protein
MLRKGDAAGVFQFESQGMRDTLKQMRVDRFEDLVAAVALYRPGPMANIPTYCHRKHGEPWEAPHPAIHHILAETYGIMVYQEQVMQIGQDLAGYSLGGADLLRRAMGKKIKAEMEKQRVVLTEGAVKNGVEPQKAGVPPKAADSLIVHARDELGLPVRGLMCIPPADEEPAMHFALLAKIAARNGLNEVSMGMSDDFETAVAFGATMVRVGSALFGAR